MMAAGATDGVVYEVTDAPLGVSDPGITQQFREAITAARIG
jgi:hypothetical protein